MEKTVRIQAVDFNGEPVLAEDVFDKTIRALSWVNDNLKSGRGLFGDQKPTKKHRHKMRYERMMERIRAKR